MSIPIVTVFGGTGFLGRRIVRRLRGHGFAVRVASRRPDRAHSAFDPDDPYIRPVVADVHDGPSVAAALEGVHAAVNAVSLYVERGAETFEAVHVTAAKRVAEQARLAKVERLVHVSGIGADAASPSLYIRRRGEGELAVRDAFEDAVLVRPAVMFGPDDAFLNVVLRLVRQLPVYPLFGRGETRLQPADVEDVAEAIVRALQRTGGPALTFECGGPRVYLYRDLVMAVADGAGRKVRRVPVPFGVWRTIARISQLLPKPPLTLNQVELMQIDSVAAPGMPGFAELGIALRSVEAALKDMVARSYSPRG